MKTEPDLVNALRVVDCLCRHAAGLVRTAYWPFLLIVLPTESRMSILQYF
jgi:hypothetical protein